MKTILLILISFMGMSTFSSCEKITKTTWIFYDETWGTDPWGSEEISENDKTQNVEDYLKNKGVKVFEVRVVNDANTGDILCFAMNCKTGNRIHAKIRKKDIDNAINAGFYE